MTLEAGARGKWGEAGAWSAAAFRTDLADDIQFVTSGGGANTGYFRNVGATRRQGVEFSVSMKHEAWELALRYGLMDATFRTPFAASSPNN